MMQNARKRCLSDLDPSPSLQTQTVKRPRVESNLIPPIRSTASNPSVASSSTSTLIGSPHVSSSSHSRGGIQSSEIDDSSSLTSSSESECDVETSSSEEEEPDSGSHESTIQNPLTFIPRLVPQGSNGSDIAPTNNSVDFLSTSSASESDSPSSSAVYDDSDDESSESSGGAPIYGNSNYPIQTQSLPPGALTAENISTLQSRLESLLPRLQRANEALEAEGKAGTLDERNIEKVDEGREGYIEMDLGLGVLEATKKPLVSQDGSSRDFESEEDEDGSSAGEQDMLGRLMGNMSHLDVKGKKIDRVLVEQIED